MHGGARLRAALLLLAAAIVGTVRILPLSLSGVPPGHRAQFRYAGSDGRQHVYLGDYDSYLWLRHARNLLANGEPCDRVEQGVCWDALAAAPVGRPSPYARSLHVTAIAWLHRVITLVVPGYPLAASAYWLPVVLAVLGVLPAYAIGAMLGGVAGGFAAAVVIGVNPLVIGRSAGADNDGWNVVLPLFAVWAALAALRAAPLRTRATRAGVAGGIVALHATIWSGWILTFAVVLGGLGVSLALRVFDTVRCGGPLGRRILDATVVLAAFVAAASAGAAFTGVGGDVLRLLSIFVPASAGAAPAALGWPNVLATVGELWTPRLREIAGSLEGQLYFFVAWLGLLLAVLPRRGWQWWHYAALIAGNFAYRYVLTADWRPDAVVATLAAAVVLGTGAALARRGAPSALSRSGALVVVVWFLATLFQAYAGIRFVLLLVAPFGLLFGLALGRLQAWLARVTLERVDRAVAPAVRTALVAAAALAVVPPVERGLAASRRNVPRIHDAWWNTLTRLRDTTPPEAIVTTWWDYGHWVKYAAERRTTADGSTLLSRTPHWIGRLLLATDPAQAAGLLRMLDCASDADDRGAYGRLHAAGIDPVAAYRAVVALAPLDRAAARDLLAGPMRLTPAAIDDVLAATHCEPPPAYLVLSSHLIGGSAWRRLGAWDAVRAWIATSAPGRPAAAVRAALVGRFALPEPEAASLLDAWEAAGGEAGGAAAEEFVAPRADYLLPDWQRCQAELAGTWECPVGRPIDAAGTELVSVRHRPADPGTTRLVVRRAGAAQPVEVVPAGLLIAGTDARREVAVAPSPGEQLGVLVDEVHRRVLLGTPALLRSTFTQLMFLDGRFTTAFEKVYDRHGYRGERVVTWRVRVGSP